MEKSSEINKLVSTRPIAKLLLADGTCFEGRAIGAIGTAIGEICFNTGMTGYQEILTDPSYVGQLMVLATPHVGNYGVSDQEVESNSVKVAGLVVKKFSETWSRPGGSGSLADLLVDQGVVGISDIDTRMLVRHIRDHGAQNAVIGSGAVTLEELAELLANAPDMTGRELSSTVSTSEAYTEGLPNARYRVALVDFGIKTNTIRCLAERDCQVKVFPMNASLEEMMAYAPHGFLLSNGPGDPGAMHESVKLVKEIVDTGLPIFGICLGHQLLAECQGLETEKMHHGHRGINHPVKNLVTNKDEVTSQNHGFVVNRIQTEASAIMEITHVHLNDHTVAGMRFRDRPIFSVQYHPEAGPGPLDSRYLFDDFVQMLAERA